MKPPAPKPSQKFQVLVIDDDRGRAQSLLSNLAALNMEGRHAINGLQGLELFHQQLPHLVLLDVMMPGLDGFEVCTQMRQISTIPIILMNESVTDEHLMKGLKLGADDYIMKSMHEQVLSAHIIAWLRRVYQYDQCQPNASTAQAASTTTRSTPVARPTLIPASEMARTQINPPAGWLRCDICGYMGPRAKFQDANARSSDLHCPACHSKIVPAHSLL